MASLRLNAVPQLSSRTSIRGRSTRQLVRPVAAGKADLVDHLASKHAKVDKTELKGIVGDVIEFIESTVENNEKFTVPGFGTFERRERKARVGRNPQTGDKLDIPASSTAGFSVGKSFKERLNGGSK